MDPDRFRKRQHAAAIIQAFYRGYLARKAYRRLKDATQKIQAHARGWYTRKKVGEERNRQTMAARFQHLMARHRERIYVLEKQKREVQGVPASEIEQWEGQRHKAASRIQAAWRGYVLRKLWVARDPERLRREAAAAQMHKAFREILTANQSQGAVGHGHEATTARPSTPLVRMSVRQSANVLMGSPEKGVGSYGSVSGVTGADLPGGGGGARNAAHMSSKRYKDLEKGVMARVEAYKALAKHRRRDAHAVDTRLKELLGAHNASADERLRAAHARQAALVGAEALVGGLESGAAGGGLVRLAALGDAPNPSDYVRPPVGSERWERATAAHALGLAEARVGGAWWRHLRQLNGPHAQLALADEDEEHWEDLERGWRRLWARVEDTESRRPDPLTEFRRHGANGRPALSDIAVHEPDQPAVSSTAAAAGTGSANGGTKRYGVVAEVGPTAVQTAVAGPIQTAVAAAGPPVSNTGARSGSTSMAAPAVSAVQSSTAPVAVQRPPVVGHERGAAGEEKQSGLPAGVARTRPGPPAHPPPPPSQVVVGIAGPYVAPKPVASLGVGQHSTVTAGNAGGASGAGVGRGGSGGRGAAAAPGGQR